jgi:hypothetical protein
VGTPRGLLCAHPLRYVDSVFWMSRPPYHRWLAAATLLAIAAFLDLAGRATTRFPFVTRDVGAGESVTDAIEWRDVPTGMLGDAGDITGRATHPLAEGEPLTAGAVSTGAVVPTGWWSVPVDLPGAAHRGAHVRLLAADPPLDVEGVVVGLPETGAFGVTSPGLVAVPPGDTAEVATAAAGGTLVVLLGT